MPRINRLNKLGKNHIYHMIEAFSGTDATKAVVIPMGRVESVVAVPLGAYAAADQLSVNATVSGTAGDEGSHIAGSGGVTTVTVTRTTGGTSALPFSLIAIGRK